jgi:hypothetical protein
LTFGGVHVSTRTSSLCPVQEAARNNGRSNVVL